MTDPRILADDELVSAIARLAARSRETTAVLIAHLVVLEERNLHLACGFNSLFGYCRRVLHCSESAAYDRMLAAHVARRFPVVLAMLADGAIHLTAVRLLAPHLKDEDHLALLGGAIHKSGREIRDLLARWFPQPDAAPMVRRLSGAPARQASGTADAVERAAEENAASTGEAAPTNGAAAAPPARTVVGAPALVPPARTESRVEPLSPGRHLFRFTGDDETRALFEEARELLGHAIPGGDMAAIFKRGLALVVAEGRRRRHAATERPVGDRPADPASRNIPASVQRAVWDRDGGQCSHLGRNAWRCEERRFLEYHHLTPWIVGGMPSVENITLRCRAHNQYEAKVYFAPIRQALSDA